MVNMEVFSFEVKQTKRWKLWLTTEYLRFSTEYLWLTTEYLVPFMRFSYPSQTHHGQFVLPMGIEVAGWETEGLGYNPETYVKIPKNQLKVFHPLHTKLKYNGLM